MNRCLCLSILALLSLLSGCVLMTADVTPQYQVDPTRKRPLGSVTPLNLAVTVEDQRPDGEQDRVGNRRNGYGGVSAPVKSTKDVRTVVQEALLAELAHNGHRMTSSTENQPQRIIEVGLKKYWTENQMNFFSITLRGTIVTEIIIRDPQSKQELTRRAITGDAEESRQLATEGAYQDVLNQALAEFIRNFSRDRTILSVLKSVTPTTSSTLQTQ